MKRAIKPFVALAVFGFAVASIARATDHDHPSRGSDDPNWSELIASMDKMHMAMGAIERALPPPQRFLIVTDIKDSSQVVLRQAEAQAESAAPAKNA
ncbi:MAG: hypothetical protein ACREIF_03895 [Chthoniobacterales bacterium]